MVTVRTFHELALNQGRFWETRVKRSLSETIFETVFPGLLRAFKAVDPDTPEVPDAAYLEELRDGAFTFLYRLLFTLYAEDRDLLPKVDPKYDDYGLSLRVRDDIARRIDKPDTLSKKRPDYYDFCLKVFESIDEGDESVGVPPFNGGLFARERSPLLYRARIPDRAFAPLLDALSRTEQLCAFTIYLAGTVLTEGVSFPQGTSTMLMGGRGPESSCAAS